MSLIAFFCLFVLALIGGASSAEVALSPPATTAPTETITPNRAFELMNALKQLTGLHDEMVGQGTSAHVAQVPYDLSADTLWALADDINILRDFLEKVQTTVRDLRAKAEADNGGAWPGECDLPPTSPAALAPSDPKCAADRKFTALVTEFDDKSRPSNKLFHVSRKDMKLGNPNKIAGPLLAALLCEPNKGNVCVIEP